ncbi:MAG TPA: DUF4344 domain-containing metallopeptidase [Myxococcaceae bacterium]|jgi:hypothetical protein
MAIVTVPSVLLLALLGAGAPSAAKKQAARVVYEAPTKPEQAPIAERMKEEHILEDAADMLSMLKLPKLLTLHARTCGESNAWYDSETHVLTFCYELVGDFIKMAEQSGHFELTSDQAVVGPFLFIVLHETAHAVLHILAIPVLGQEEDAADQLAVLAATHFGGQFAERMLRAAAFMYDHDSKVRKPGEADFADVHGLDRQRFYNVLCLAWGADPKLYDFAKDLGKLPDERAEWCGEEYEQVRYAVRVLIRRHVDDLEVQRVRAKFARSKFAR